MKKTIFTFISLAFFASLSAQNEKGKSFDTGKLTYVEKTKFEIKQMDGISEEMMAAFPKERSAQKVLYFTPDASLYVNDKANTKEEVINQESEGAMVQIYMTEPDDKTFCDLKTKKRFEQSEFMSRMFLIESEMSKTEWKLTGKQRTFLDYPCQEAILQDTGNKVLAWFTPMIPVQTGPGNYGNLPGLILALDINDGKTTITATSIDLTAPDKSLIVKPKEGKKVTQEQFTKIQDEKMKEMGQEGGGSGTHIIMKIER